MIRLPLPTIAIWLSLGIATGWWLHDFYQLPTSQDTKINQTADAVLNTKKQEETFKDEIETLIKQDEYELIFSRLYENNNQQGANSSERQKTFIKSLSKLSTKHPDKAQQLLRRFLEEDAYNPDGLFLLAQTYFNTSQHMRALEALFDLKSFNQTTISEEDINSLIEQIESSYVNQLESDKRIGELLQLYEFLTSHDPENTRRFYKLAEIQHRLHHYYDALTSLGYVLYDSSWGKLAQDMAQEIQQSIDLDNEVQVPLQRSGKHFIVNARINGIDGARLMIDTGASLCILRPQIALQFGLPTDSDDYVTVNSVTGVINAPRIEISTMSLGDAEVRNIQANIIEMPPSLDSDGLLGMNFLNNFKFFIDQKQGILYLGSK